MQNPPTGYTDVLRGPLLLALLLPCRTGKLLVRSSHQTSEGDDGMSFKATYNVLATAYLDKGDYLAVPQELLDPAWRVPAVRRRQVWRSRPVAAAPRSGRASAARSRVTPARPASVR